MIAAGCWRRAQRRGASEVSTADVLGLASALSTSRGAEWRLVRMAAAKWLHDAAYGVYGSGSTGSSIPLQNLLSEMQTQSESAELALMALAALPEDPAMQSHAKPAFLGATHWCHVCVKRQICALKTFKRFKLSGYGVGMSVCMQN